MADEATTPAITVSEEPNGGWDARLRWFHAGDEVDTFALVTQRYVVVIDTMATPELAAQVMRLLQPDLPGRTLLVVNTHADYDHSWGNDLFVAPGSPYPAPIIGQAFVTERLATGADAEYLVEMQGTDPRFAAVRIIPPTITFGDTLRIDGGDLTIELLPTPGHVIDHLSVWVPELRLLLPGYAAGAPFPYVGDPNSLPAMRVAIERLRALGATMVIPCHGGTTDPGLLDRNLAYFDLLERLVRDALATHTPPANWRDDSVTGELPDALGLPLEQVAQQAGFPLEGDLTFTRWSHACALRATLVTLGA